MTSLPGFKTTTTIRSVLVEAACRLVFERLSSTGCSSRSFEEVAEITSGGTPTRGTSAYYGGEFPWAKIGDVSAAGKWIDATDESISEEALANSSAKLFPVGTVLFSMYGSVGKTTITKIPMATNQAILGLIPLSDISAEFLYYALIYSRAQIFESAKGTSQKNINAGIVRRFRLPVCSFEEQVRVARLMDAVETGRELSRWADDNQWGRVALTIARIEKLAGKIQSVHDLRQEQEVEIRQMLLGAFQRLVSHAPRRRMQDVAPLIRRAVEVEPSASYSELGIRSFGKGTFHKPSLTGIEVGDKRVFRIEPGDLLFSNVFAWEGAIAVAKPEDAGRVGSHRFITCVPRPDAATARFLCFYFLTQEGLDLIRAASPGGALRNRTLGLTALANILVPSPAIADQRWFDALQAEVDTLKRQQAEAAIGLDALLPAILHSAFKGELV